MEDECEDPKAQPITWVSKVTRNILKKYFKQILMQWVDYSDKYGFGYSLNDDSIGVVFNDLTKLLLLADGLNIHYIDYEQSEHYYTLNEFPATVEKKVVHIILSSSFTSPSPPPQVKLLNYFRNYMKEHLLKAGANMEVSPHSLFFYSPSQVREEDQLSRIAALKTWFRTSRAVVMHLSNGTMQINFFKDHAKVGHVHLHHLPFPRSSCASSAPSPT